jgi:hypothetical protein
MNSSAPAGREATHASQLPSGCSSLDNRGCWQEGKLMDGSSLSGADSWIDVKGSDYVIRGNQGRNASGDGYQTHVINNMGWGSDNLFDANIAIVNSDGFGFYVHDAGTSNNTVLCNNEVSEAGAGFANLECT